MPSLVMLWGVQEPRSDSDIGDAYNLSAFLPSCLSIFLSTCLSVLARHSSIAKEKKVGLKNVWTLCLLRGGGGGLTSNGKIHLKLPL